jgi:hypothetical protein
MNTKNNNAGLLDEGLLEDISDALKNIHGWGSIEVFIQNYKVVQITERNIKKTEHIISESL